MTDEEYAKEYPSLDPEKKRTPPYGRIQWKGTDVCMDLNCDCGELTHIDGEFCDHIKCMHCYQVYECDGHIVLNKLDFEPEMTKVTTGD